MYLSGNFRCRENLFNMCFWTNLLWVLLACARGWAALSLYKMQEDA